MSSAAVSHASQPPAESQPSPCPRQVEGASRQGAAPQAGSGNIGPYRLLERIGHGTLSAVFRAQAEDGRLVAIKLLSRSAAEDQRRLLRFYQGAKLAMALDHPGIVQTLEVGCHDGRHFVAMQHAEGGNLAQYIMQHGPFTEEKALELAIEVATALEYVHRHGVLHRDLNPANLLLDGDGRVLLGDLGLSKDLEHDLRLTCAGMGLGTPDYIAPEQIRDTQQLDWTVDIYGLGATLYVMLTGKLPFAGGTLAEKWTAKMRNAYRPPKSLRPDLHPATLRLIESAMHANPRRRPADAAEFSRLARNCLALLRIPAATQKHRPGADPSGETVWRVLVPAGEGRFQCRTGTTGQVIQAIVRRQFHADTLASRDGAEHFTPLGRLAPFQHLFRSPAAGAACQCPTSGRAIPSSGGLLRQALEMVSSLPAWSRDVLLSRTDPAKPPRKASRSSYVVAGSSLATIVFVVLRVLASLG